jgi:hypothetical protein
MLIKYEIKVNNPLTVSECLNTNERLIDSSISVLLIRDMFQINTVSALRWEYT